MATYRTVVESPQSPEQAFDYLANFENVTPYDKKPLTVAADGARERHAAAMADFVAASTRCREALRRAAAEVDVDGDVSPLWREATAMVARFDGEKASPSRLFDVMAGQRLGAVHGLIVQIDGKRGSALRFDGDDYAVLPRLVEQSFSVTFWVSSTERGNGRVQDPR